MLRITTVLALFALAAPLAAQVPPMPLPGAQRISTNPDPLVAGQPAEVCYNRPAGPIMLTIRWALLDGTSLTDQVLVSPASTCARIDVPANALVVLIEDGSGVSPDYGDVVAASRPGPP